MIESLKRSGSERKDNGRVLCEVTPTFSLWTVHSTSVLRALRELKSQSCHHTHCGLVPKLSPKERSSALLYHLTSHQWRGRVANYSSLLLPVWEIPPHYMALYPTRYSNLHNHGRENLKSYIRIFLFATIPRPDVEFTQPATQEHISGGKWGRSAKLTAYFQLVLRLKIHRAISPLIKRLHGVQFNYTRGNFASYLCLCGCKVYNRLNIYVCVWGGGWTKT
jgi:hypothetical protein